MFLENRNVENIVLNLLIGIKRLSIDDLFVKLINEIFLINYILIKINQ